MVSEIKLQKITQEPIVRFNGELIFLPTDLQKKIEENWQKLLEGGRKYFNGEVFRFYKMENKENKIIITLQKTDFKHFLYAYNANRGLGKYNLKTVFSSCLILTKDNKIIFGKMGEHTSLAGRYQLVGGGLDSNDLKDNIFDMKHSAIKELGEELGIDADDKSTVESFKPIYLKTGGNGDVAVIYKVLLNKIGEEVLEEYEKFTEKLKQENKLPEFSEIVVLPKNKKEVEKFINKNKEIMAEYLPAVLRKIVKGE